MIYTLEQATRVASQLEKLATYNVHQLAGQFPNLDFWLGEAIHALQIIDDYPRRFKLLRDAQERWVNEHGTIVSEYCPICGGKCEFGPMRPSPPTRTPSTELDAARRSVRDGAYHLLLRLHRVGWIDKERLMVECERVGTSVDLADLEPR
ncbi:hypothetical protein LZC95_27125 [Pendulispora brunnea]|uniref:Uncharacterized protein n=1 Tax=Pendulispora brunnea TaxID=2905690 RepID=A0ABZ2JUH8_9BACT